MNGQTRSTFHYHKYGYLCAYDIHSDAKFKEIIEKQLGIASILENNLTVIQSNLKKKKKKIKTPIIIIIIIIISFIGTSDLSFNKNQSKYS